MEIETNIKSTGKEESIRGLSKEFKFAMAINIVSVAAIVAYIVYKKNILNNKTIENPKNEETISKA